MKRTVIICFSPTGSTLKTTAAVGQGLGLEETIVCDLTRGSEALPELAKDDVVVVGVPVYSGRIPKVAVERLQVIKGSGQPVVCVAVFGNNSVGDALQELAALVSKNGFRPIGGGAFVGEHSFSNDRRTIAKGRPNKEDLGKAKELGKKARVKLDSGFIQLPDLPGSVPTSDGRDLPAMASQITKNCIGCGKCVAVCPVEAIDSAYACDRDKCIKCFACVKACPQEARELKHPMISVARFVLSRGKDKEVELFI